MTRVLVVTSNCFWRRRGGSQRRIASLIEGLRVGGCTVAAAFVGSISGEDRREIHDSAPCQVTSLGIAPPSPPPGSPIESFRSQAILDAVEGEIERTRPDVVLIEFLRFGFIAAELDPRIRQRLTLVIDTHDVMHERCESFEQMGLRHWVRIDREEEARQLAAFDVVVAIQAADADTFRSLHLPGAVVVAPYCAPSRCVPRKGAPVASVGFIGANSPPNVDALAILIEQILPTTGLADRPRIVVAGEVIPPRQSEFPVRLLGLIDDPDSFHREIDVLVNPVRMGGGLKIKNVEALAAGRPVVTTRLGAQGLEDAVGSCVFVADEPTQAAALLAALLEDHEQLERASVAALRFAASAFAPSRGYAALVRALREQRTTPQSIGDAA